MPPDAAQATDRPRRVFVIGPSGSGKSTLARELGSVLGVPVHDLDLVYREGGGNGPPRDRALRDADLADIARGPGWVAEGIHLDGTEPLTDGADLIVWLDHVSSGRSSVRIMRRFVSGALLEVRRQRGWRRFFRFRDYARHLHDLARAMPEARAYTGQSGNGDTVTRAQVAERLAGYGAKVVRCSTDNDLAALLTRLRPESARFG